MQDIPKDNPEEHLQLVDQVSAMRAQTEFPSQTDTLHITSTILVTTELVPIL